MSGRLRRFAMGADSGDFDHRRLRHKAHGARRVLDRIGHRGRRRLADGAAFLADQEYDRIAALVIMHAGDERVAALDAMDQYLLA